MQERNKPTDAPKKPEAAPFFLPAAPALASDPTATLDTSAHDVVAAAPLRMSRPDGTAVAAHSDQDQSDSDEPAAAPLQRQVMRVTDASAKLWATAPLFAALKAGDGTRAAAWLAAASAVQIERQVASVPPEEPYDEVRSFVASMVVFASGEFVDMR